MTATTPLRSGVQALSVFPQALALICEGAARQRDCLWLLHCLDRRENALQKKPGGRCSAVAPGQ